MQPKYDSSLDKTIIIFCIILYFIVCIQCNRANGQCSFITIQQYDTLFVSKSITVSAVNIDETSIAFDDNILQIYKYKNIETKTSTDITNNLILYTNKGIITLHYFDYKNGLVLLSFPYFNTNLLLLYECGELLL